MSFPIEIISVGGDFYREIEDVSRTLNAVQKEFQFSLPPPEYRHFGQHLHATDYHTAEIWELLKNYRDTLKGHRPFLIAVVNGSLRSEQWANLFGSHRAAEGFAVITLKDHELYAESFRPFLSYYFIRYTLSFVCPILKSHKETRNCFFDFKERKIDLKESLDSGNFCESCRKALWQTFTPHIYAEIQQMVSAMKALREGSTADIPAGALKGDVDVGIITIRADEFTAVLNRFPYRRSVKGLVREYYHSRVKTRANEELSVAIARAPAQGTSSTQALATNMINELEPKWIFVVGIAGGFADSDFTLGDVLLSTRVHDFSVSAALEGESQQFQEMGGPMHVDVENLITNLPANSSSLGNWSEPANIGAARPTENFEDLAGDDRFYGNEEVRKRTFKSLSRHFPKNAPTRDPLYFGAPMISGNTLLKDTALGEQWKLHARHAAGVEMELAGACQAARYAGGVRVLAIRGISDIVGYKRRPEWTDFACQSAAAFAFALIISGLIRRGH